MSEGMSESCEVSDAVVMSSAMDALRDENKRLKSDLNYYQKCCELYENYRKCLLYFDNNCVCIQNKDFYFVIESLEMQYKTLLRQDMQFTYQLIQNHTKTLTPQPFATTSAAKDTKAMQLDDTSNEDTSDQTSDDEDIGCDKQNNTRNELNAKQTRHSANASVYQLKNGIKERDGSDNSGANRLKFMCSWIGCDLRFRDNYALKAHIRLRHTNERPFACTDCHKSFADKKHLKEHQKIHSTGGQMFRCEFTDCHYETRREANLKEHVLRHKNIRNYKCDESGCDKSFVTNYELKVHKSHVHSEDRPFTCDWPGCEATYKSKQRLDDHKLSHLGVRQFACDFHGCAKNFITKKKLTQHRNEHIKPYACSWPECGEAFGNNRALKAHMNAHEGVRPYKCQFPACVKAFYSKPQLNSHLKSAHKNVEALDPLLDAIAAKSHALSNADPMSANPTNLWTNTAMIANQTTHSNKDQTSLLTTQHMPDSYQQKSVKYTNQDLFLYNMQRNGFL